LLRWRIYVQKSNQTLFDLYCFSLQRFTRWGYDKISMATGVAKSTVQSIIKQGNKQGGNVHDAPLLSGPTKITDVKRRKDELVIDGDP
jgi:hypothetical protein